MASTPASSPPTSTRSGGRFWRRARRLIVAMILIVTVVASILLAIDNQTPVSLRFLDHVSRPWPVAWWMALAFASGAVAGLVAGLGWRASRRFRRSDLP